MQSVQRTFPAVGSWIFQNSGRGMRLSELWRVPLLVRCCRHNRLVKLHGISVLEARYSALDDFFVAREGLPVRPVVVTAPRNPFLHDLDQLIISGADFDLRALRVTVLDEVAERLI